MVSFKHVITCLAASAAVDAAALPPRSDRQTGTVKVIPRASMHEGTNKGVEARSADPGKNNDWIPVEGHWVVDRAPKPPIKISATSEKPPIKITERIPKPPARVTETDPKPPIKIN